MGKDLIWACPRCRTDMIPGKSALLTNWHCEPCGFDWVPGVALASFLPTIEAFEKLRTAATAGQPSTRPLLCPLGHGPSLRLVKAGNAEIDVCPKCVGVALDPGELRGFKSIGYGTARKVVDAMDIVYGAEALVQLLTLFY